MRQAPADARGASGPLVRHRAAAWTAVVIVSLAGLGWAGYAVLARIEHWGTPSCSWPLQVRGPATPAQAGLVRCYLRALAHDDSAALLGVAAYIPPVRITKADLRYSADARSGLAAATLAPNPSDDASASVTIRYADGVTANAGMINMIAMGGPDGWRMTIGTDISPGPSVPTAAASP